NFRSELNRVGPELGWCIAAAVNFYNRQVRCVVLLDQPPNDALFIERPDRDRCGVVSAGKKVCNRKYKAISCDKRTRPNTSYSLRPINNANNRHTRILQQKNVS